MVVRSAHKGFTLIELLIVVAIIAILAAIAVPNFLEAQIRSKVSRTRADARTAATAVEAYCVDNNRYPIPRFSPVEGPGNADTAAQFLPGGFHSVTAGAVVAGLTSPVAYITTSKLKDPFADHVFSDLVSDLYYQNIEYWYDPGVPIAEAGNTLDLSAIDPTDSIFRNAYGAYKMGSLGPDKDYSGGYNMYDPTNGTVSGGDIYRTQTRTQGGGI